MHWLAAGVCAIVLGGAAGSLRADCVACPPSAAYSTIPAGLQLVGTLNGVPDPLGEAVVTVRDDANQPVANTVVTLAFGACYDSPQQDVWIAPSQPFPGLSASCSGGTTTVSAQTNLQGRAVFRLLGSAQSNAGGLTVPCVTVSGNNHVLGTLRLGAYDLDGGGGVNGADLNLFLKVLFSSPAGYRSRADYNGDGLCNSADLAKLRTVIFAAGSLESSARCVD